MEKNSLDWIVRCGLDERVRSRVDGSHYKKPPQRFPADPERTVVCRQRLYARCWGLRVLFAQPTGWICKNNKRRGCFLPRSFFSFIFQLQLVIRSPQTQVRREFRQSFAFLLDVHLVVGIQYRILPRS